MRGGEGEGEGRGGTASCIGCAAAGVVLQDWATVSPDARSAEAPRCELVCTVHHARVECVCSPVQRMCQTLEATWALAHRCCT